MSAASTDAAIEKDLITTPENATGKRRHRQAVEQRDALFALTDEYGMADMIRDDLAVARDAWLKLKCNSKIAHRSDFLLPINDAGERLDFHSLRHTCGAWLALRGVHPKTIQTVMRHKTITLTMDTYGRLVPEAELEAIGQLGTLLDCQ